MELTEKTIDSCTRIRLKSGESIEVHLITNDTGKQSLIFEKKDSSLILGHKEIIDFINLFTEFLNEM